MQYRIVQEEGFSSGGLWWAEEKTSFGWERIPMTMGFDAEEVEKLYRVTRTREL